MGLLLAMSLEAADPLVSHNVVQADPITDLTTIGTSFKFKSILSYTGVFEIVNYNINTESVLGPVNQSL